MNNDDARFMQALRIAEFVSQNPGIIDDIENEVIAEAIGAFVSLTRCLEAEVIRLREKNVIVEFSDN